MSKERRDADYLEDILEAIQRILVYTKGMNWQVFLLDYKTQDAVIRNLEVIGEASNNLSDTLIVQKAEVPWKDIAGVIMRIV